MSPDERHLYVDGGCLDAVLRSTSRIYFDEKLPPINWNNLRSGHSKVFYYDAVPTRLRDEDANAYDERVADKREYLHRIAREAFYHVRTGDAKKRRRAGGREQKRVDVQLAVDAILAAVRGGPSKFTLLTGDLDFAPLIDALVSLGVAVTLMYPPGETSDELIEAADVAIPIDVRVVYLWSTERFRSGHAVPEPFFSTDRSEQTAAALFEWQSDDGSFNRLHRAEGAFDQIDFGKPNDEGQFFHVRSRKRQHFRPFLRDAFRIELPADFPDIDPMKARPS